MSQTVDQEFLQEIKRLFKEACFSGERFRLKGKDGLEVGIVPPEDLNLLEAMEAEDLDALEELEKEIS